MNISQSCLDFYVRGRARLLYQLAHAEQVQAYSNERMRPQRLGPLAVSLALTLLHVNGQSSSSSLVCNTKYLVPGTSATTHEYVRLPSVSNIRAISMWFFPLSSQPSYAWKYIIDARTGLGAGWISYLGGTSIAFGNAWSTVRWDDMSTPCRHTRTRGCARPSHSCGPQSR